MRICTGLVALVALAAAVPAAQAAEGFEGFYAGFSLGAHSHKAEWYTTDVRYRNGTRVDPTLPPPGFGQPAHPLIEDGTSLPSFLSDTEASLKDTAYAVGLILGYNWEVAPRVVVGLELAAGAAPTHDRTDEVFPGLGASTDDPVTHAAVRTSKPMVVGLRGGFIVAPNTLAYVRVNYERIVAMGVGVSTVCPASYLNNNPNGDPPTPRPCDPNALSATYRSSEKLYGWGYGLGVEHKISDSFALRLEYRRAEYGKTKSMTIMSEADDNFGADALIDLQKANMVELGVLFHF